MLVGTESPDYFLDKMWETQPGTTVESGLLTDDPRGAGVEVTGAGDTARWEGIWVDGVLWDAVLLSEEFPITSYARVPVTDWASFWQPASGGVKLSTVVQFTDSPIRHRRTFNTTGI